MHDIIELKSKISKLRELLYENLKYYSLSSPEIILISQKLDNLIVKYELHYINNDTKKDS